jgi:branched-chain amino acid transport system substrate-binding protein
MKAFGNALARIVAASAFALAAAGASAQTVKVGVVLPFSGVGAEFGQQVDRGIQTFMKLNPSAFGPYKIELVKRDSKAPSGADAKTAVQELIVQDKVDILTGFVYSPDAIASAALFTEAKKPAVIMNAGTAWITNLSPMISRVSFSMWHAGYAMGEASVATLKGKTAVVGYTDFPPGKDSLDAFKRGFEAKGGKVIDEIPMGGPGQVPDFTPFFQRAKDKKPDVFFVFVPSGDHAVAVAKTYSALGMKQAGIKLVGPGDLTPDHKLQSMGDAAVGMITIHHYNADLNTPANKRFVDQWKKDFGANSTPDFMGVQGYDGMAAIAHMVTSLKGKIEADAAINSLRGWKYDSPRGPISIDPRTRDIVMNEYVSELVKAGNRLTQKNIATINAVKDMCKELKEGRCKD